MGPDMTGYKRWSNVPTERGVCFVTTTVEGFLPVFEAAENAQMLLSALDFYRSKYAFHGHAYVVMPEHAHLLLGLNGQITLPKLMADFKRYTAKQVLKRCNGNDRRDFVSMFKTRGAADSERHSVWQRSFRSVSVLDEKAGLTKAAYIHDNPVRRGLVSAPEDWRYSSAGAYAGMESPIPVDLIEL